MIAIYRRELKGFFTSITGFVFIAFFTFFAGIYTMVLNLQSGYPNFEYVISNLTFFYLLGIPILTMRSVAEERKQRTDQLIYALPLKMGQIVCGKYFAMCTVLLIPMVEISLIPLALHFYDPLGGMQFLTIYSTVLGFYLLGCTLIAIGLFISSLTENQIVAAILSFFAMLLTYLIGNLALFLPSTGFWLAIQTALTQLAIFERLGNFIYGLFDVTSVIYFISIGALFVFFTVQVMEKRRWS